MMLGRPCIRSSTVRMDAASRGPANSVTNSATSTPSGAAMTTASAQMISVPTISGAIPPPTPVMVGDWVMKFQVSAPPPRLITESRTMPSTTMASTAAARAEPANRRLTALRRRRLPLARSGPVGSNSGVVSASIAASASEVLMSAGPGACRSAGR